MKKCIKCGETKVFEAFSKKLKGLQPKCKVCSAAEHAAWYAKNKEKAQAYRRARYLANREHHIAAVRANVAKNPEARKAYEAEWRAKNKHVKQAWYAANADSQRAAVSNWRKANPGKRAANDALKRTVKRQRVLWADRELIADIYAYARIMREAGVPCHVDHELPLRGKLVSGLHVPENLVVIPAEDNLRKSASFTPE